MASVNITQSELLAELAAAAPGKGPTDALTLVEMATATGRDQRKIRMALMKLDAEGRLLRHQISRTRLNGTPMTYVGFTILPAKKGKR